MFTGSQSRMPMMDALDARILLALDDDPDATALALARRLGIARNTLHARLQRLRSSGAVREFSRRVDPAGLGRSLIAFVSIAMSQATGHRVTATLSAIPEVVEVHATTGEADLLLKVVARDTADLHRITGEILAVPGVVRTSTVISLREELPLRLRALLEQAAQGEHRAERVAVRRPGGGGDGPPGSRPGGGGDGPPGSRTGGGPRRSR